MSSTTLCNLCLEPIPNFIVSVRRNHVRLNFHPMCFVRFLEEEAADKQRQSFDDVGDFPADIRWMVGKYEP